MKTSHGPATHELGALAPLRRRVMRMRGMTAGSVAFGAGALSALSHAPFYFWPLLLISLTMLVWMLDGAALEEKPGRAGFWRCWAFATGYFISGLWWLANAFLARGPEFAPFAPLGVLAAGMGLALFWGVGGAVAASFWRDDWRRIFLFAAVFGLAEYVRGHIFGGFPWNAPGYVWPASWPMAQASAVIGIYGLSLVTLLAFAAPAAFGGPDRRPSSRAAPFLTAMALFAVMVAGGFARLGMAVDTNVADVRLRAVQVQISQREKNDPANRPAIFERYLNVSSSVGHDSRTHLIWPEAALPIPWLLEESRILDEIARSVGPDVVLMTGLTRRDTANPLEPAIHNSFAVLPIENGRPNLAQAHVYDKHLLVPFGEFIPMSGLLENVIGSSLSTFGSFTPGPDAATLAVRGAPAAAPQICYESVFPGFTPRGADRPGWIVNVSNDAWFGTWVGPEQAFLQARYRAIEEGLPVVRSASGGVSGVIDAYGRVRDRLPAGAEGVVDSPLPIALPPTPYALVGDAGVILMFVLALIIAFRSGGRLTSRRG